MAASLTLTVQEVEGSVDKVANTSKISIVLKITTSYGTWNETGSTSGTITLDGAQIASLAAKKVHKNTTTTLYSAIRTVQHDPDGKKTVQVAASFDVNTSVRWIYANKELVLTDIPRASELTAGTFTLGSAGTIHITPATEGLRHTLRYTLGSSSGTIAALTESTTVEWTPPTALAAQIPDATSAQALLTLETYSGETLLGSREVPVTVLVPGSMVPSARLTVWVESDGAAAGWGVAVKGHSRLCYEAEPAGGIGASVTQVSMSCAGQTVSGSSGRIPLQQAGAVTPRLTVTDSRGRTAVVSGSSVQVHDYHPPVLLRTQVRRCSADGSANDSGVYVSVLAVGQVSSVDGNNGLHLACRYRRVNGSWSGETTLTGGQGKVLSGFAADTSYEVEVVARDDLGEEKRVVCTVPTESVSFALAEGGVGAGFGKYPEQPGVDMAWGVWMNGHPLTGLPDPVNDTDATPWGKINFDRIYPVGSIYLSVASTDPAALFGGTWQRIRDVFLLASGSSYALGSTGGEAQHTLTVEEMPSHRHETYRTMTGKTAAEIYIPSSSGTAHGVETTAAGGSAPHNNMPPYLAVNVWKRTA